jgi:hypothetical protein
MILNLMRVEDLRVEDMLARSFAEFHAQRGMSDERAALALDAAALRKVRKLIDGGVFGGPERMGRRGETRRGYFLSARRREAGSGRRFLTARARRAP